MMFKSRKLCLGTLLSLTIAAAPAWAAEKPQLSILDTAIVGSESPYGWSRKKVNDFGSVLTTVISQALEDRFRACTSSLNMKEARAIISWEKQEAMLGSDDASMLAELGGALGKSGLLVRSSATYSSGVGWTLEVALINTATSRREAASTAAGPPTITPSR